MKAHSLSIAKLCFFEAQQGGGVFVDDAAEGRGVGGELAKQGQGLRGETLTALDSASLPVAAVAITPPNQLARMAADEVAREMGIPRGRVQPRSRGQVSVDVGVVRKEAVGE